MAKNSKSVLTLVRNKKAKTTYPRTDQDSALLKTLGVSIRGCTVDFLPLLTAYAKLKKVKIDTVAFEELEDKALGNLERKWPGGYERKGNKIVLSCPKDKKYKAMVISIKGALQRFYRSHDLKVEYAIKRGSKNVKVTFIIQQKDQLT